MTGIIGKATFNWNRDVSVLGWVGLSKAVCENRIGDVSNLIEAVLILFHHFRHRCLMLFENLLFRASNTSCNSFLCCSCNATMFFAYVLQEGILKLLKAF